MTKLPTTDYNGVLFVHSTLNRFEIENKALHAGPPGLFLRETVEECGYDYNQIAATTADEMHIPAGTKKAIIFGADAAKMLAGVSDFNAERGFVKSRSGIEMVATYAPVDCTDVKDYEDPLNTDEEDNAADTGKDSSPTSRKNFRFWHRADIIKLLRSERRQTGEAPGLILSPGEFLRRVRGINDVCFLDIETHPPTDSLQCLSVAGLEGPVYTLCVYDHRGRIAGDVVPCLAALAKLMSRAVTVVHNALFDLPFLAHFHGIPFGRKIEDTMLMQHRAFPEAEKSLGHCISYWLNAPYHKDESGTFTPRSWEQMEQLLVYNAKDVARTRAIWVEQVKYAKTKPGLKGSMHQVNRYIYPAAMMTLTGVRVDTNRVAQHRIGLNKQVDALTRILRVLTGMPDLNPGSPKQIGAYLYDGLKYPVTDRTAAGLPSTASDVLYKFKIKYPKNVALDVLLELREKNKQVSMLDFERYYRPDSRTPSLL